ncbi:MAG TPA: alpha/beta fold hydrolase [Bacilli bacterium]|nr:alpha/beta fold hydrolase [Bacilli bacterium]
MKKTIVSTLALALLFSCGLSVNAQGESGGPAQKSSLTKSVVSVATLPKVTGAFQVGTTNFDWVDVSRKDSLTSDPKDNRELMVQVWYPIDNGNGKAKETYIPSPVNGIESLAHQFGMGDQFAEINKIDTDTYKDAALSNQRNQYPVVLFSHGLGRARWEYQSITRELASHGYIVVSVDHTDFNLGTEFKDGRFVPIAHLVPDFTKMDEYINQIWVKDLQFVIRQLVKVNQHDEAHNFKGKLDLSKIAAVGHSFGGAAAARALQLEPKIKAAIDLDGSLVGLTGKSGKMEKPFAFIKTEDHAGDLNGVNEYPTPPGMDPKVIQDQMEAYRIRYEQAIQGDDAYDITIAGTRHKDHPHNDHMSFTDHPLLKQYYGDASPFVADLPGAVNPADFYQITNNIILSFLDKYLMGKRNTLFELRIDK